MIKLTIEFIENIEFPDSNAITMQSTLYKEGLRYIYKSNPNQYYTLFGDKEYNSYWAQRMYNLLQGADSHKKLHSFKKIKANDDKIRNPDNTDPKFYETYFNLPLFFKQFDMWIDGAAAQARDYYPFIHAGLKKTVVKLSNKSSTKNINKLKHGPNHNITSKTTSNQTTELQSAGSQKSTTISTNPIATTDQTNVTTCNYCGRYHRPSNKKECVFKRKDHPHVNNEPVPFSQSSNGKIYAARGKTCLEYNKTIDGQDMGWATNDTTKKGNVTNHILNALTNHVLNHSSTTYFNFRSLPKDDNEIGRAHV